MMCRTQVVNNVSHGDIELASGLNLGIVYLFSAPLSPSYNRFYIVVQVFLFQWGKK